MYRTIKIEIKPDKDVEEFLIKNCEYRHFLYNKAVELVKKKEEINNGCFLKYSKYDLLADIRILYEKIEDNKPEYLEEYDFYFRGISECVCDDIYSTIHHIITDRSNKKSSDLRFMKYNPNKLSFRFKNKMMRNSPKKKDGLYQANRIILTENPYLIGIKINKEYPFPLGIQLKESFTKLNIDLNEVKEICFKFHNEKWYLVFRYNDFKDYTKCVDIRYKRKEVAGIDLGETNPVVIYSGKRIKKLPKHLEFPKERIKKAEVRVRRLQSVLDKKYNPLEDRFHQSNNYYKVLKKFHKAWEHLVNIKKDWHFKVSHWIVTHYKNIIVDEFKDHIIQIHRDIQTCVRKRMNHSMYNRSMYDFTVRLQYMCKKYGTNYFNPDEIIETTNTCSICGHVNINKLDINNRTFKCESCGYTRDRDENASINCYHAYFNNLITLLEI